MTSTLPTPYPFSALVGQDQLRLALILCAVRPEIGGVLIRGEKGTAKSTAVRALASVLADVDEGARLVELPIGATEDRVVGSLDLQRVLRDGEHAFSPGLLARAHGGVLYVDEVNLLHDHLVDVLLDAAAMGRVHIERDGVSHSHEAKFMLVGTMNPEEGELRPQLLDRFGLTVDVRASRDVDERADVIRRRMAFEADPGAFVRRYAEQDAQLAQRIADARRVVDDVVLPDGELRRIAALCAAFGVDGMRADLVIARAAVAHAAWRGTGAVAEEDVRVAARLALPHRRRRDPFDEPGVDDQALDDALRAAGEQDPPDEPGAGEPPSGPDDGPNGPDSGPNDPDSGPNDLGSGPDRGPDDGPDPGPSRDPGRPEGPQADGRPDQPQRRAPAGDGPTSRAATGEAFRAKRLEVPGIGEGAPGRRSRARTDAGRVVRASGATPKRAADVHLPATVLAAAPHQRARGRGAGRLRLHPADLR